MYQRNEINLIPELEKKKKELREMREMKGVRKEDFLEFDRKYKEYKEISMKKIIDKKEKEKTRLGISPSATSPDIKSKKWDHIIAREREMKEKDELISKEKKKLLDKRVSYSRAVKDIHAPRVDEKKRIEIQIRIEDEKLKGISKAIPPPKAEFGEG